MKPIILNGQSYPTRGFNELCGEHWRWLILNLGRVAESPLQFLPMAKANIEILSPATRQALDTCSDIEVLHGFVQTQELLSEAIADGKAVIRQFSAASEAAMCVLIQNSPRLLSEKNCCN